MAFIKNLTLTIVLIAGSILLNSMAYANDFLDTDDGETNSLVMSTGSEAGFYFNVTLFYDENVLPKSETVEGPKPVSEFEVASKLSLLEPEIEIAENSADCEIYQVYYTKDEAVVNGTNVTYAYLIKTDSSKNESSCHVKVYNSDFVVQNGLKAPTNNEQEPHLIREIFYITAPGE